jgi:hypothetical protein
MTDQQAPPPPSPSPSPPPPAPPPESTWFGEPHKEFVTNKGWKSGDDAITSFQNLEKLIGADKAGRTITLPKDEKDVEGMKAFRAKLGVPEKAEDYGIAVPEGHDPKFSQTAASWMHELGIPKEAGTKLAEKWNAHFEAEMQAYDQQVKDASEAQLTTLKGEWGDSFATKSEQARRFMKMSGFDDAAVATYERAFGTATMLKQWAELGAKLGGHEFIKGDGQGGGGMNQQRAREEITKLTAARVAGTISEKEFHSKMQTLGPIAHP